MSDFMRSIPITPDMVSLWVPSGLNRAQDLIRGNHGQCYGTHPNVPVISVPYSLSNCDELTGWSSTLGDLSIDTEDKKEGVGSLKVDAVAPEVNQWYAAKYNPTGSWDWSDKKDILFWLKCSRASTAFLAAQLVMDDTSANYGAWVEPFSAGEWVAIKKPLQIPEWDGGTPPNMALIDSVRVQFKCKDTIPFYFKIDDLRIAYRPSLINPSVGFGTDGLDDHIDCGTDKSLALTRWTTGAWIYRKVDSGTHERLMSKSHPTVGHDYRFFIYNTDVLSAAFYDTGSAVREARTTETIPLHEWEFVTATFDGTYIKLFINADLKKTSDDFSAYTPRTTLIWSFYIGRQNITYNFNGYIALPFIANQGWSQAQIDNFYNATKGMFTPRG